jgi:hypothetical protein
MPVPLKTKTFASGAASGPYIVNSTALFTVIRAPFVISNVVFLLVELFELIVIDSSICILDKLEPAASIADASSASVVML